MHNKTSLEEFAFDHDRMARFQREAQLLVALNHPHIATIHGLEETGSTRALVMELVEGPTLADRIAQGAMPIDEVLRIAKQIAEALEYAHERGVVHRDLKPANVKLTAEGQVKVLDFGLAKALNDESKPAHFSNSPTISLAATQAGIILGTAAYMPPEQAKGKTVDRRADIWAFGVVVFEMLTGKMLFAGETASETLAFVMTREPDWTALPLGVSPRLTGLLRRCLTKDPRNRLRDIGEARIALEDIIANHDAGSPAIQTPTETARPLWRRVLPWVAAGAAIFIAAVALWTPRDPAGTPPSVARFSVDLGVDASLKTDLGPSAVLSPDGKTLVFVAKAAVENVEQLYIRRLDKLQAISPAGTEQARNPFFSPDGQWIGFFAGGKLKKISVNGGPAVVIADAADDRGGTWSEDGSIIWGRGGPGAVLQRVSSGGGAVEPFTILDEGEANHRLPQALPGGGLLFISSTSTGEYRLVVQRLPNGEKRILQRGVSYGRYVPSGHLLYVQEATLFAAAFDLDRLEMTSPPLPVLEGVGDSGYGGAHFGMAGDSLIYLPGTSTVPGVSISWMDHNGTTESLRPTPGGYGNLRFSPDGRQLLMDVTGGPQIDVMIYEWGRDLMSRVTFDLAEDRNAIWSPDGRGVVFASGRANGTTRNLYWQREDGTGGVQRLTESTNNHFPMSWHPSEKFLAFSESRPQTGSQDIGILPMESDKTFGWKPGNPELFFDSPFVEREAAFSPDGNWLAYESNESGIFEVYVRGFPGAGGKSQISTAGGAFPTWSRNGKELFYRTPDQKIWVVTYTANGESFRADRPRLSSQTTLADRGAPYSRNFDLHPDGQRFAVLQPPPTPPNATPDRLVFILNFAEELRRLIPGNNP